MNILTCVGIIMMAFGIVFGFAAHFQKAHENEEYKVNVIRAIVLIPSGFALAVMSIIIQHILTNLVW